MWWLNWFQLSITFTFSTFANHGIIGKLFLRLSKISFSSSSLDFSSLSLTSRMVIMAFLVFILILEYLFCKEKFWASPMIQNSYAELFFFKFYFMNKPTIMMPNRIFNEICNAAVSTFRIIFNNIVNSLKHFRRQLNSSILLNQYADPTANCKVFLEKGLN